MTHLSSEQISEWTLGERNAEVQRHLEGCRTCHEDVLQLQGGLRTFRQTAHAWAERDQRPVAIEPRPRRAGSPTSWTWAAATLVTVGMVLRPVYLDERHARSEAQSAEDSLLLAQVQQRLTRTVPHAMEQLMELMNEGKGDQQ
jgi:anti-sigma factor RsiW